MTLVCNNCSESFNCTIRGFCRKCYNALKWKGKLTNLTKPTIEKLSDLQHQVLIGSLLGDTWLGKNKTSKYPHLKIERSIKDIEYLKYQFSVFENLCKSGIKEYHSIDKRNGTPRDSCYFISRSHELLEGFWNDWYSNGIKKLPLNLELTPLTIAIWLADDGNICIHHKKQGLLRTTFATNSFLKSEVELLALLLSSRYGESFRLTKTAKSDQYVICADNYATMALVTEIDSVFPSSMNRKSNIWRLDKNELFNIH